MHDSDFCPSSVNEHQLHPNSLKGSVCPQVRFTRFQRYIDILFY
jgi:hypothetical protein